MAVEHVDGKEAYRLQPGDEYAFVDVRSIPDHACGHPAGTRNVPLLHSDAQTGHKIPNPEFLAVMQANDARDATLLVGCQVGGRSTQAAQM